MTNKDQTVETWLRAGMDDIVTTVAAGTNIETDLATVLARAKRTKQLDNRPGRWITKMATVAATAAAALVAMLVIATTQTPNMAAFPPPPMADNPRAALPPLRLQPSTTGRLAPSAPLQVVPRPGSAPTTRSSRTSNHDPYVIVFRPNTVEFDNAATASDAIRLAARVSQLRQASLSAISPPPPPTTSDTSRTDHRRPTVFVTGYTAAFGDPETARALSAERAWTVANLLLSLGVETQDLAVTGLGYDKLANPAANPRSPTQRAVTIKITT